MSNTNTLKGKEDEKPEENFEKVSSLIDNLTTPASYNNGDLASAILSITDISERKRVEQALSKSQKKYSGLFQNMIDGFACCQALFDQYGQPVDYVFSDVNEAFKRLIGLVDKPVLGRKVSEVVPKMEEDPFDWVATYSKVSTTSKPLAFEKYCSSFKKCFSIRVYCPENGYLAIILEDITQRKKVEQDLRQNEKQYKKLANSITDLFVAVDSSLKFTYWNKATEKYTKLCRKKPLACMFMIYLEETKPLE